MFLLMFIFVQMEFIKFQITNHKYQTNHNDQNSKFQTCFGHYVLEFEIYLEFGA